MRKLIFTIMILLVGVTLFSCTSNKRAQEVASYTYKEDESAIKEKNTKVAEWVKEEMVCYGLVLFHGGDNIPLFGEPVKVKVMKITDSGIILKSLENIKANAIIKSCNKIGLRKGETWVEKEGDVFKTKEEAINYLKEKKLYMKEGDQSNVEAAHV